MMFSSRSSKGCIHPTPTGVSDVSYKEPSYNHLLQMTRSSEVLSRGEGGDFIKENQSSAQRPERVAQRNGRAAGRPSTNNRTGRNREAQRGPDGHRPGRAPRHAPTPARPGRAPRHAPTPARSSSTTRQQSQF
jgi:hypothetical protein